MPDIKGDVSFHTPVTQGKLMAEKKVKEKLFTTVGYQIPASFAIKPAQLRTEIFHAYLYHRTRRIETAKTGNASCR